MTSTLTHTRIPTPSRRRVVSPSISVDDPDLILMRRVAAYDEAALKKFMRRFGKYCDTVIFSYGLKQDSADILQNIWIKILTKADSFDPQKAKLITWIGNIIRHECIDFMRRKKTRNSYVVANTNLCRAALNRNNACLPPDTPKESAAWADILRDMNDNSTSANQLLVLKLSYAYGFSQTQIAIILDIPASNVKSLRRGGLDRARRILHSRGFER